jgi:hypothetical protein
MKINAAWHSEHKMPKNPTLDERITWHVVYAKTVRVGHLSGVLGEIKMRKLL